MASHAVSKLVNNPRNERSECVLPVLAEHLQRCDPSKRFPLCDGRVRVKFCAMSTWRSVLSAAACSVGQLGRGVSTAAGLLMTHRSVAALVDAQ
jgi:hypothetical protein